MGFVPGQSIERVVAYARSKGQQRFVALIPKNLYGPRATGAFRDMVSNAGGTLVAIETYDRSATALSVAARRLAHPGAQEAERIDRKITRRNLIRTWPTRLPPSDRN